ncbi:MAG: hypothetical protein DKT66_06515 [Candidatus Melainabacteria bacterium]|nr:MAG: hypothetical protein DKT66_06515 [Candidatus Melainabacteria bacterium]
MSLNFGTTYRKEMYTPDTFCSFRGSKMRTRVSFIAGVFLLLWQLLLACKRYGMVVLEYSQRELCVKEIQLKPGLWSQEFFTPLGIEGAERVITTVRNLR